MGDDPPETGRDLRLTGRGRGRGVVIGGHRIDAPPDHRAAVLAFPAEARRRRDDR